jgi:hypothetical protein
MSFSRYMRDVIARDLVARATTIGLLTGCESDMTKCVEVSAPIYARQNVRLVLDAGGGVKNAGQIEFPWHPGSWGSIRAYGVFDGASNLLYQFELPEPVPLPSNYGYIVKDGELAILMGGM